MLCKLQSLIQQASCGTIQPLNNGNAVVVQLQENGIIIGQLYDSNGFPIGSSFQINNNESLHTGWNVETYPTSVGFVVAWVSAPMMMARFYQNCGTPYGSPVTVANSFAILWFPPAISALPNNEVMILAYTSFGQYTAVSFTECGVQTCSSVFSSPNCCGDSGNGILNLPNGLTALTSDQWTLGTIDTVFIQFLNGTTPIGNIEQVSNGNNGYADNPYLALVSSSAFALLWANHNNYELNCVLYNFNGQQLSGILVLNTEESPAQGRIQVVTNADSWTVYWQGSFNSEQAIYSREISTSGCPLTGVTPIAISPGINGYCLSVAFYNNMVRLVYSDNGELIGHGFYSCNDNQSENEVEQESKSHPAFLSVG